MPAPPPRSQGEPVHSIVDRATSLRMGLAPEGHTPHPALSSLCPRIPPSSIMAGGTPDGAWGRQPTTSSFKMGQTPEVSRPYKYCFHTEYSPGGTSGSEPLQHHGQILMSPRLSGPTVTGEEAFFFFFLWMARCLGLCKVSVLSFLALIQMNSLIHLSLAPDEMGSTAPIIKRKKLRILKIT
ncbi:hypothetical protein HJG60_008183 [Phyllostomus discolor]|uniref:Uncharacterized protein n=1 Tax=Phyllostomus discolor TaxID=89673 RepID=A0A834DQ37_9CHIR|nr:hypothetical protein HJG60_008183 [Phyllostomus discolor]